MLKSSKNGWKAILILALTALIFTATGKGVSAQSQAGWRGEYYNNMTLSGSPAMVRIDPAIDFNWGTGSPAGGIIGADGFSVRWTGSINVTPGRYRFIVSADDGVRLWVNGQLVIDKWLDQQGGFHEVSLDLTTGSATVQMDYYENQGGAKALLATMRAEGSWDGSRPWTGEYFNNKHLMGQPILVRSESEINFDWGTGSPATGTLNADGFSARWTRQVDLVPGRYKFTATTDDGVRLWVNNQLIVDQWRDQPSTAHQAEIDLPGGTVPVKMEYYENTGGAKAQLTWVLIPSVGPPGVVPGPGTWRAEYFNNNALSGLPVLVRDEGQPNSFWGTGSPAPGIVNSDNFSVRWTRTVDFIPGRYRFTVTTDDGVRLWVNNQLIIDNWRNQPSQSFSAEIDLAGLQAPVRMEYYEATVLAEARLSWQRLGPAANTGGGLTAVVLSNRLNVRQGPGMAHTIITQITGGQVVQLAGFRNAEATWVKVILPDGRQGWSYAAFLQGSVPFSSLPVEVFQPAPIGASMATVSKAAHVNLRTGPGVSNSIITTVPSGSIVELLGRNTTSSWAKIRLASGTVGWMNGYYLTSTTPISSLPIAN